MSQEMQSLTKGNIIDGKECAKIILSETKEECDALFKYVNVDSLLFFAKPYIFSEIRKIRIQAVWAASRPRGCRRRKQARKSGSHSGICIYV
jgi:hypothetical protein